MARTLSATLTTAQQTADRFPRIKLTLSKSGESDVVIEQDKLYGLINIETPDSQTADLIVDNTAGSYTSNNYRGWAGVLQLGMKTSSTDEYSTLPPFKVLDQEITSETTAKRAYFSLIGIPNRLAADKASTDYLHHATSTKTVKDMITEVADDTAVADELEINQTSGSSWEDLDQQGSDIIDGLGQRVFISHTVTKLSFYLKKTGSPAGTNVTFYIKDTATFSTLASGTYAIASIGTTGAYHEVTFGAPVAIDEECWIYVEYTDGTATDYVSVGYSTSDQKGGEVLVKVHQAGTPGEAWEVYHDDLMYKYKYSDAGIDCFTHCEAYTVTYDSEDSLIDAYQPQDAFQIYEGESRWAVLKKLLRYTGCEMRVEDDGEIHVFVPKINTSTAWAATTAYALNDTIIPTTPNNYVYICTTAGTSGGTEPATWSTTIGGTVSDGTVVWTVAYDYKYDLDTGHAFFSKANREALVIPNKITVHSYPDDDDQYTGNYTSAASYALLPVEDFVRTKLASNAQATSIATAMISQLEIEAQTGSAVVPINVGAEVYDFNFFNDSRMSDTRNGNIGYIKRVYTPGRTFNMSIALGGIAKKGVAGTKPSALIESRAKVTASPDEQVIRWATLKPALEIIEDNFEYVWDKFDSYAEVIGKLGAYVGFSDYDIQTSDKIASYYTKAELDKQLAKLRQLSFDDVSVSRSANIEYQNGGYVRWVVIRFTDTGTLHWSCHLEVGASAGSRKTICSIDGDTDSNVDDGWVGSLIPPWHYYFFNDHTNTTIDEWLEMDLGTT
jgi:hypothetical protein